MIKAIIFDLDGVLVDSIDFMRTFFMENHSGITKEMYRELFVGNYLEESKKYTHLIVPRSEEEKTTRFTKYTKAKSRLPLFDGMKELLEKLHSFGFILILNTTTYNKTCLPLLEYANIHSFFDFIATADISKSKVEKFEIIKERYALTADEIIFVTDSLGDVREAGMAHIPTVAVTWGVHDTSYFTREQHNNLKAIVHKVDELKSFIEDTVGE